MVTNPLLVLVLSCTIFVSGMHLPRRKKRFEREGFRSSDEKQKEKHTEVVMTVEEGEEVSTSIMPEEKKFHTRTPSLCGCVCGDSGCLLCSSDSTLYVF